MEWGYFASTIGRLAKKRPKFAYGTSVEVDAYIHWAGSLVVLSFVL